MVIRNVGEKATLLQCCWGCKSVQLLWKTVQIPQKKKKIKNKAIVLSSYSTSGYLSKEYENTNLKRYIHPYVHLSIIYNSQDMEIT